MTPDFNQALTSGRRFSTGTDGFTVTVVPAGRVSVRSGRLSACDPTYPEDGTQFARALPVGEFPVVASMASWSPDGRFNDIACVAVRFSDEPAVEYVAVGDGPGRGFAVDSGMAALGDSEAILGLAQNLGGDPLGEEWFTTLALPQASGAAGAPPEIVIWATGGDAFFACYWGLDARGSVVVWVWDAGMLPRALP